jgi:L-ascorbate metabolism protein UlaG (beta-lactamase superfamily)
MTGNASDEAAATRMTNAPEQRSQGGLRATRLGHSTVLFDFGEEKILSDPWFSEKFGYYRGEPLALGVGGLPHLSAVIVSHDHYDHFDLNAFDRYSDRGVLFIVMRNTKAAEKLRSHGFSNVRELLPWESADVGKVRVTAAPGKHGVPEITYVLEGNGTTTYFGGDTLWIPELEELPRRFSRFDLALLPINGLTIRLQGNRQVVMTPEEAARVVSLLRPALAVPIHYAFKGGWLMDHLVLKYNGSVDRFRSAVSVQAPGAEVRIVSPGEVIELPPQSGRR